MGGGSGCGYETGESPAMNRRDLLIGLGTAAVGTSAIMGTSAFTTVSSPRQVTIQVSEDSEALVGLDAGDPDVVKQNDGGELEITTEDFGAFNEDATVEIGNIDDPSDTPAFTVTNNFDIDDDVDVTLDLQDFDTGDLTLHYEMNSDSDNFDSNGDTTETLGSTEEIDVAIEIDTEENDLSGDIEITAEPTEAGS